MRQNGKEEVFGVYGEYDVFGLEPDPAVYEGEVEGSAPDSWDGPNGVFLARRGGGGRVLVIAGMRRVMARRELSETLPNLRTVGVNVFEGISDDDARALHDASNIYARAAEPGQARRDLLAFRGELVAMHRRYDFGPLLAASMNARVGLVVGRSARTVEEARTYTRRFTPYLLDCYDRGIMSSYAAREISSWGKDGKGAARIEALDAHMRAEGPSDRESFAAAFKRFSGGARAAGAIEDAIELAQEAAEYYESAGEKADAALAMRLRGAADRLLGAAGEGGCPYLRSLMG